MTTYVLRRLLLIIPTLIGVSFLVFMLLALSPGGMAAALVQAGGEGAEAGQAAVLEAYLEERYGLNDPVVVQYGRWLSRISPIKFGERDQLDPNNAIVRPPKPLRPPPLAGSWYATEGLPAEPEPTPPDLEPAPIKLPPTVPADEPVTIVEWLVEDGDLVSGMQAVARVRLEDGSTRPVIATRPGVIAFGAAANETIPPAPAGAPRAVATITPDLVVEFRRAESAYAAARRGFIQARTALQTAMTEYARSIDRPDLIGDRDKPEVGRFEDLPVPDADGASPELRRVLDAGAAAVPAFERALDARARLLGAFRAKPFREAGFWIIPGAVSVAAPDLGQSFSRGTPVTEIIGSALPVTLLLNSIAIPIIYIVAIPMGVLAAVRRGSWIDVGSGALFIGLFSIPVVWAGVLAVGVLGSKAYMGEYAFPSAGLHAPDAGSFTFLPTVTDEGFQRGYLLDALWHLCLPVLCLVYAGFAVLSKQTRAAMLENFNADYVRTAKAKGVAQKDIVFRHVLRNSLLPLITIFATVFPAMLAGSVVIEQIFSVPGMGSALIQAIYLRDRELLLAIVVMVALVNMLALLLADILYALADPRIAYD